MKYDLIVVGTGFASTFFLKKYLEKNKGKKVLVLERGYIFPHTERLKVKRGEHSDYEKINPSYENAFINHTPEKEWRFTIGFGGSSNCWWGCTPRFMPNDFKLKSLYGVAEDWPIDYNDLETYYEEAEQLMSVSGPADTIFPRKSKYPLPPHFFTKPDKMLHEKYGVLYNSQPTARARQSVNGRNQCIASATCELCPIDAKFTIENSNIGVYENKDVEIIYGAEVYNLTINNNKATKINYFKNDKEYSAESETFVLGSNPLFNTNILLNSGDKSPQTGRGLGEQLGIHAIIYLKDMNNIGGSSWVNANGYMLYDGEHRRKYGACLIEVNNSPTTIRLEKDKWLNAMSFRLIFEDLPQYENYVTTSNNKLVPQVFYNAGRSKYALDAFEQAKIKLPQILNCLPVEKIEYPTVHASEGHILGGTRMGTNGNNSVVDKYLIHHQYRNVIVLGAGAFTTYSPSNPTLTIAALSLFSADKNF